MSPETIQTLFEIGGAIARHIWEAIKSDNVKELEHLKKVWPPPISSKIALLEAEEKARQKAKQAVGGE